MSEPKKTKKKTTKSTEITSLSSSELVRNNSKLDYIKDVVDASVNNAELQKGCQRAKSAKDADGDAAVGSGRWS